MRIASITAGAAGMFCGSCLRDNTLAAALQKLGHDAILIPTYTPLTLDEIDAGTGKVFFGGVNVYLQQKSRLFRHTPRWLDAGLDSNRLLRYVSRFAARTPYSELADLTVSMLEGTHGHQAKELDRLVSFLESDFKPDVVLLTNVLLSGLIPELQRRLKVPVVPTLQGDDIFLDVLPDQPKARCLELIRENCAAVDTILVTSEYYADAMSAYMGLPREIMRVVAPGLSLAGHGRPAEAPKNEVPAIGYYARVCPEKGFHLLVDAFIRLRSEKECPPYRLRASGWLGESNRAFFDVQRKKLDAAGLLGDFEYVPTPDHKTKVAFFHTIDLLSVPTTYREPKGLYVLEAWANGVPVLLPAHGAFPELIAATGAGVLHAPNDPTALAAELKALLADAPRRAALAARGTDAVETRFTARRMAEEVATILASTLPQAAA